MSENKPENQFSQRSKFGLSEKAIEKFFQNMSEVDHPSYDPPENLSLDAAKKIKSKFDKIEQSSLIDPLTGCYNEKYLTKFINENFNPCRDHHLIGLVYVDVNNLKKTNDTLGHQAGDELIKQSASYLKKTFRTEDIVVHLHGDEFVVICSNHKNDPNFSQNLPRVVKDRTISKPPEDFIYLNEKINFSIATGVAVYDRTLDLGSLSQTLHRADILMQTKKAEMKAGR